MISGELMALEPDIAAYEAYIDRTKEGYAAEEGAALGVVHRYADDEEILLSVSNGGYALLRRTLDPNSLFLDTVFVDEEARGNRVGSLLVSHALDTAREFGYERLTSKVHNERVVNSLRAAGDSALAFSIKTKKTKVEKPLAITPDQVISIFQDYRVKNPEMREDDLLTDLSVNVTVHL